MEPVSRSILVRCFITGRFLRYGQFHVHRKSLNAPSRHNHTKSLTDGMLSSTRTLPAITLTNSMSRKKELLQASDPSRVTWYCCGPTVYDSAHMGHAYAYVQFDLIRRFLEDRRRIKVQYVMNITDIDDKIIARANEKSVSWMDIAAHYEKEFFEDMDSLNVKPPNIVARISDFIPDAVNFVQRLLEQNLAYVASSGSVYFDTRAYGRCGKFKPLQEDFAFVGDYSSELRQEKKSPADFALWKAAKANEPSWLVPFSHQPGRPGWHLECSTVATHFFGPSVDLHSGGIDLMFPHHENEESQCCAVHNVEQWVKQWLHTGHLLAPDEAKMSKSLKNFVSIRDFLKKYSAVHFRIFCMMHYYRSNCALSEEEMKAAQNLIVRLTGFLNLVEEYRRGVLEIPLFDEEKLTKEIVTTQENVESFLADDFNFPQAIFSISKLVTFCYKQVENYRSNMSLTKSNDSALFLADDFIQSFFGTFGVTFPTKKTMALEKKVEDQSVEKVMDATVQFRNVVRQIALSGLVKEPTETLQEASKKLLKACDSVRDAFLKMGFRVKDHGKSSTWEKVLEDSAVNIEKPLKIKTKT